MHETDMLMEKVIDEIRKIGEKGLTTQNLDIAYKLVDIYKDIKEADMYEEETLYRNGHSGSREKSRTTGRHLSMSGDEKMADDYERYMDHKSSYRYSGDSVCKKRMMDTLEEYMDSFVEKMEDMLRDADCQEERDTINRYIGKIRSLK